MVRILGLDVGSKTVGVAVSDPFGWTAQGLEVISINENKEQFGLDELVAIIKEYKVEKVVIGLPKNMDGSSGERVEKTIAYGDMLKERVGLPIIYQDERLTTMQAERMLVEEADVSRKNRRKVIDKVAAVLILQNYLNQYQ